MKISLSEIGRVIDEHPIKASAAVVGTVALVLFGEGFVSGLDEAASATSESTIPADYCEFQGTNILQLPEYIACAAEDEGYDVGLAVVGRHPGPGPNELPKAFQRIISLTNTDPYIAW